MVLESTPIETCLPLSIIHYVERTQEGLIETNVAREGRFTEDAYIKTQHPKSILCAPLLNQGQLIGIVYLENNLAYGVFTPDRLEVIQLLSSQAAIALTNARLYTQVQSTHNRLNKFSMLFPWVSPFSQARVILIKELRGYFIGENGTQPDTACSRSKTSQVPEDCSEGCES
jgi:hypothetical protein